jgi:UDP-N-acetylglucosamine 3-dehydrogenase
MMGSLHAACATEAGFRVVACASQPLETAEALAATYDADAVADAADVFARDDVDVVCIATPTPTHADYVVAAAEAGKHIFCEKPLGRDLAQCDRAIDAAQRHGVKLYVGHVVRFFHEFEAIRAQIDAGKVGKAGFVKTFRGGISPLGAGGWFRDIEQSGGATLDMLIHDFDWLRYTFGDPERVFSQNLAGKTDLPIDYVMATFRFPRGIIAQCIGSWAHPAGFRVKAEVCGSGGMIQFDSQNAPISAMPRETESGPSMIVPASPVNESPYTREWRDFANWLAGDSEPKVTADDARWAVRMALAALESAECGQPVEFD